MPLYSEGDIREETKSFIEVHLKDCNSCSKLYKERRLDIFEKIKEDEPEAPKEKKFLLRLKKAVIVLTALILIIITTSTVLSFESGKVIGIYGERFRLAEEKNLFIDVNQEKVFQDKKVVFEKVLLDSGVTSIIVKTSFDVNNFDSITLKDDKENYYRKVHTFFNGLPREYSKVNGYTVLNFEPVSKGVKVLKLEMIYGNPAENITFEVNIDGKDKLKSLSEYKDVLKTTISGVELRVDKVLSGVSQSEMYYTFDRSKTGFDGVSLGWYHKDMIGNKDKLAVIDGLSGKEIPVLSNADITHEALAENAKEFNLNSYKAILNPISPQNSQLKLQLKELYGYYNLGNKEITADFRDKSSIELNKKVKVNNLVLTVKSIDLKDNKIELIYEVKDENGNKLSNYILDARIRTHTDIYAVPKEGKFWTAGDRSSVIFETGSDKVYVISLARLGLKLQGRQYDLGLK